MTSRQATAIIALLVLIFIVLIPPTFQLIAEWSRCSIGVTDCFRP